MLKPSYIFLWIIFHITAVELPNKIKKKGLPYVPVTELVARNRFAEAIVHYKSLEKVEYKEEWYSLAFAFDCLGYVDTAEILMSRMFKRFPDKITPEDKLLYSSVLRKKSSYETSDSLIKELKTNSLYASQSVFAQFSDAEFLKTAENEEFLDVNLEHFRSVEGNDVYGIIKSPIDEKLYMHERQPVYSGLVNNVSSADTKPYGRIKEIQNLNDTIISNSTLISKQVWNRHLDLTEIDQFGNQFVTISAPLINDFDKYLLNIRLMKYDTAKSKIVFKEIGFDRLAYNSSGLAVNPSHTNCVFSSDIDGSLGMADLHMGTLVYGEDGNPEVSEFYNLGSVVNSIKGEYDATFISDDIIMFASEGHVGFGSKDLFAFHLGSQKLVNLGAAINSRFDEITPKFIDGFLYFSSNRIANRYDVFKCSLDINRLENLLNPATDSVDKTVYGGSSVVSNETSKKLESFKQIRKRLKEDDPRKYNYTRGVDFLLADDSVRVNTIDEIDSLSDYRDYKFMTLFHPSGDIVIEAEFEKELQLLARLLKKRKDWAVVIRSHTDRNGSDKANINLSKERAGFLADYLKYLKVSKEQIIIEGLGEAYPINHCFEGAPCTEEELAQNRRTELLLIKHL
jgi:outer membrane protein OmpA-like peptidoglycan-associated protein